MNKRKKITYIIPCFNEENNIPVIYDKIKKIILSNKKYLFEIVFVDDCSKDKSFEVIKKLSRKDKTVKCISFSKNFGHQSAIKAGIDFSNSDAVITMDCDLQHPPELTEKFISIWDKDNFKIIHGIKRSYKTSTFRKLLSYLGYKIINFLSPKNMIHEGGSDFCLYDKTIVDFIKNNQKKNLVFRSYVNSLGFEKSLIYFEPFKRLHGKSNYSFFQMFEIFKNSIVGYSVKPLRLIAIIGFFVLTVSILMICLELIRIFSNGLVWPSGLLTILILQLFFGGFTIFCIGIIGEYISYLTEQLNGSPEYVITKTINR